MSDCKSNSGLAVTFESQEDVAFVARQPIFDVRRQVVAYKLLYRSGTANVFLHPDQDEASAAMLDNLVHRFNLDAKKMGFVQITPCLMAQQAYEVLPNGQSVVGISGDIEPDNELIVECVRLCKAGYKLALSGAMALTDDERLPKLANFLMIDCKSTASDKW